MTIHLQKDSLPLLKQFPQLRDVVAEREDDEALLQEVLALKPKYREVILLYYYQDLKISEIAQALQAPESTISVRLKRAREQLKKRLEGWEFD